MIFIQSFMALALIASVVGMFATLNYLKKIALRIPDDRIARRAGFLMYAIGISYGAFALLGLILALGLHFGGGALRNASIGLGCFAGIATIALVVFGIMYLLMLEKLGKRFKEAEAFARLTWAMAISPI